MNTTMIILGIATYIGAVIVFFSLLSFGREIEEAEVAKIRSGNPPRDLPRRF